jgi:cupin 2 domain-containing protein
MRLDHFFSTGGVASLNHRLMSDMPPVWRIYCRVAWLTRFHFSAFDFSAYVLKTLRCAPSNSRRLPMFHAESVTLLVEWSAETERYMGCEEVWMMLSDRTMKNIFANLSGPLPGELVDVLAESRFVRIERIVSTGHRSPDDFWYDQDEHEWVVVLQGEAKLIFEGDEEAVGMKPGDFVNIPAHRKHRVEWTMADAPTVWLAVFYREQ